MSYAAEDFDFIARRVKEIREGKEVPEKNPEAIDPDLLENDYDYMYFGYADYSI